MSTTPGSPTLPVGLRIEHKPPGLILTVLWRNMASWALLPLALVAAGIPVMLVLKTREMPWNHPIQSLPAIFGIVALIFATRSSACWVSWWRPVSNRTVLPEWAAR